VGGAFAGFAAGVGYAVPPRTYYRDAYWTLQVLLPLWPEMAREQLLLLARGVHPDGEAPSGVVVASPAGERVWRARRAADPALAADHPRDGEWWADHTDAPLFFALLACDVAAWTHDPDLLATEVDGVTIRARVEAVLERAHRLADASGLPVKPEHDRDWADNVFRGGHVTYDVGLYHGALVRVADLIAAAEPERAARYRERARRVRASARRLLWSEAAGHFVDFRTRDGRVEDHLAIDTLTALRFGLADEGQAARTLAAIRARLETRHNAEQPYGDWGVMNVFPPYAPWVRRRGKSRFPYRYHDGADWPYWDGVYAEARLARGLDGWRYPLTRWWRYGLERGWATPIEYFSPPYGGGSPANAWSSMPAAAMLLGGFGVTPDGGARRPPWGPSALRRRAPDGGWTVVTATDDGLEVDRG
jgi:glycogen debranching enzyme